MNKTENYITQFYKSISLNDPRLLSIESITDSINIELAYWTYSSAIAAHNNRYIVFINESINELQQWQEFGHEMSHYFTDHTQPYLLRDSFINYCETKADYFAYHFCVPTFMLQQLKEVSVYDVMELFNVEFDFAMRRLEMYQSKIIERSTSFERTHN